jgi:hypothetical protein
MIARFEEGSGGIYGQRVFSWSTGAGLYAIAETEQTAAPVPGLPPEDISGTKVGKFILAFAIILVGAVIYLSQTRTFTIMHASFFGLLMIACLLAYGKIGEKTFSQLVPRFILGRNDE